MTETNCLKVKNYILPLFCFSLFVLFIYSCENKIPDQQIGLLTDDDSINIAYVDTFAIYSASFLPDSIITNDARYGVIGSIKDIKFGSVTADLAVELSPLNYDTIEVPKDSIEIVFARLSLLSSETYGDTSNLSEINVYELSDTLNDNTDIYSNTIISNKISLKEGFSFDPDKDQNIIDLPTAYVQRLINFHINHHDSLKLYLEAENSTSKQELKKELQQIFKSEFPGLYIESTKSANGGCMSVLPLAFDDDSKRLSIYIQYKNVADTSNKIYDLYYINSEGIDSWVNIFKRDTSEFNNLSIKYGSGIEFIQGAAGAKTQISIPGLRALRDHFKNNDQNVVITLAELCLPVYNDPLKDKKFLSAPTHLSIREIDENNEESYITDQELAISNENAAYVKGSYNAKIDGYLLNITREVNDIIEGDKNIITFTLSSSKNAVSEEKSLPYRVLLSNAPNNPFKLKIYYSIGN